MTPFSRAEVRTIRWVVPAITVLLIAHGLIPNMFGGA